MDLRPIRTKKIYEEIVDQIKALISAGNLKPGDRLPSERDLADLLQVSRTSLREALCALDMAGVIEIKSGEGAYVRMPGSTGVIEPLALVFAMEKYRVREILEVRKALEVESAGLAAERAGEADLEKMDDLIARMEEDLRLGNTGEEADLQLHFTIAEATKNSMLIRLMNTLYDAMNQTLRTTRQLWLSSTAGTPQRLMDEHRDIVLAIKGRNKARARDLMYHHLWKVEQELSRIHEAGQKSQKNHTA